MKVEGRHTIFGLEGQSNGCNFYRIRQPMYELIKRTIQDDGLQFECSTSSLLSAEDTDTWMQKSDVIFTQMAKSEKLLDYMVFCKQNKTGTKFVIDYDDLIFNVSPFNPSYRYHGLSEVDIENADGTTYKLRDGDEKYYGGKFDIEENKKYLRNFALVMKFADMVISPSSILSGHWKRLNKNTRVIKNMLDLDIWKPLPLVKDEKVRIIWQGGWSHYLDWFVVKDVIPFILDKYKHVQLVIMGQSFEGHMKDLPKDRVEVHGFEPLDVYPWKFKTLNGDIGICPLDRDEFSSCKSELKWEEYSSLGIPTVASSTPPYNIAIRHGKDGFLASDTKEWIGYLSLLIENKETRLKVGNQARERMEQDYDIKSGVDQYIQAFKSLYRSELVMV